MIKPTVVQFTQESASCRLVFYPDDKYGMLSHVWSYVRGQGHATRLLQKVMDYVDDRELTLYLKVQAYAHPTQTSLTNEQLESFYHKFGFMVLRRDGGTEMIRKPNPRVENISYNERENSNEISS